MFTRFARSLRVPRTPLRVPQTPLRTPVRGYAAVERPPKDPKIRYFVAIALVVTGIYAVGVQQKKGSASQNQVSEEQVAALKPKTAFKPEDVFVVFVLGGPGSGKGTQCDKIVREYDFKHLSAGDLLRAEQARPGSEYGQLIADYIKSGRIVPQEVTIALLRNAMDEAYKQGTKHFLIDGFPRKMDQALTFEKTVAPSKFTLFFQCPESVMTERLIKRGETSGRADDNIESILKRFRVFGSESMPVVEYYDLVGKVSTLQCTEPVDQVYARVQSVLASYNVKPRA